MRDWLNCRSPPPSTTNLALDETKQPPACPSRWWTIASPSVSRSCRAMQRAAAGKADRAVGSVDGPTLLLAEVRSDLGKFDKWPVLCLPVRIVDGGEMSLIEVSKLKYRRLEQVRSREFAGTGQSCHSCGGIISISQSPVPSPASVTVTSFLPVLTSVS